LRNDSLHSPGAISDSVALFPDAPREMRGVVEYPHEVEKRDKHPKRYGHYRNGCRKEKSVRMNERAIHADSIARARTQQIMELLIIS
jgi:hypothetical protein